MKRRASMLLLLVAGVLPHTGCDSKTDTVTHGREAVKEVVTQPFNTLDAAKESLKQSEEKSKAALEEVNKTLK